MRGSQVEMLHPVGSTLPLQRGGREEQQEDEPEEAEVNGEESVLLTRERAWFAERLVHSV